MKRIKDVPCFFCGKLFKKLRNIKYCSDECRIKGRYAKETLLRRLRWDVMCDYNARRFCNKLSTSELIKLRVSLIIRFNVVEETLKKRKKLEIENENQNL